MITTMNTQPSTACAGMYAPVQGASPRRHVAGVVLSVFVGALVQGAPIADAKRSGQGSRAWSPPV